MDLINDIRRRNGVHEEILQHMDENPLANTVEQLTRNLKSIMTAYEFLASFLPLDNLISTLNKGYPRISTQSHRISFLKSFKMPMTTPTAGWWYQS
jgi:methyltransferase-like protein